MCCLCVPLKSIQTSSRIPGICLDFDLSIHSGNSCLCTGVGGGPITGCQKAAIKGPILSYAQEIAQDELNHLRFLRVNLGNASVACPAIDIGPAFATLGAAAYNVTSQEPPFSPYFDPFNFLLGAYTFEDVGASAYKGVTSAIQNRGILAAHVSILAAEGYHAGIIRSQVSQVNTSTATSIAHSARLFPHLFGQINCHGKCTWAQHIDESFAYNNRACFSCA